MEYLLKASAVICLFYLLFCIFLKKETFFEHNRWFLLIGLAIALIFPFIVIPIYIPIEPITVTETVAYAQTLTSDIVVTKPEAIFSWTQLLPIIYAIGFSALFFQFLFQFGSLVWLLLKNPKNAEGIYTYVIVKSKISPFSFFKWIVFNPENYNTDELELILTHEKVHVNQLHSIDILFTQLACVIFWFNPLIWLYRNEVRQNLEYIADSETQTISKDEKEYQRLLLKTSIANHMSLSNNFYNSQIKKRIIMLHKSKSNTKKQWKYLLILPLLAGLLISMNTKEVFVESDVVSEESKPTIEFIVNKNTTDDELKQMSKAVEEEGGTLLFSNVKRNSKDELINVFVKLYDHSYGAGDSKSSIDAFIIYKELFGNNGGYVGRPHAATMHFKNNQILEERLYKELEERAVKKMQKFGLKDLNNVFKEEKVSTKTNKKNKLVNSSAPNHTLTNKSSQNKHNKLIALAQPKVNISSSTLESTSITIIDKNTSDKELDEIKENLKKEGLTIKFKGVKRNNKGEITAIKIEAKSENSNTSYNTNSDEAIEPIKIVFDENNNSISIGNGHARHDKNTFVYKTHDDGDHIIHKSGSGSNVFVISDDEHEHEDDHDHNAKIVVRSSGKKGKIKKIRSSSQVHVISGDDDDAVIEVIVDEDGNSNEDIIITKGKKVNVVKGKKVNIVKGKSKNVWVTNTDDKDDAFVIEIDDSKNNIFISDDNGKNPLIIIDGKEVSKDKMTEMDTDKIESVTVLKDKSAITKYGNKAKDGVIIIKTKKN